jgi:hypothetical protein
MRSAAGRSTRPLVGDSHPEHTLSSVVLPHPDPREHIDLAVRDHHLVEAEQLRGDRHQRS